MGKYTLSSGTGNDIYFNSLEGLSQYYHDNYRDLPIQQVTLTACLPNKVEQPFTFGYEKSSYIPFKAILTSGSLDLAQMIVEDAYELSDLSKNTEDHMNFISSLLSRYDTDPNKNDPETRKQYLKLLEKFLDLKVPLPKNQNKIFAHLFGFYDTEQSFWYSQDEIAYKNPSVLEQIEELKLQKKDKRISRKVFKDDELEQMHPLHLALATVNLDKSLLIKLYLSSIDAVPGILINTSYKATPMYLEIIGVPMIFLDPNLKILLKKYRDYEDLPCLCFGRKYSKWVPIFEAARYAFELEAALPVRGPDDKTVLPQGLKAQKIINAIINPQSTQMQINEIKTAPISTFSTMAVSGYNPVNDILATADLYSVQVFLEKAKKLSDLSENAEDYEKFIPGLLSRFNSDVNKNKQETKNQYFKILKKLIELNAPLPTSNIKLSDKGLIAVYVEKTGLPRIFNDPNISSISMWLSSAELAAIFPQSDYKDLSLRFTAAIKAKKIEDDSVLFDNGRATNIRDVITQIKSTDEDIRNTLNPPGWSWLSKADTYVADDADSVDNAMQKELAMTSQRPVVKLVNRQ